MIPKIIHYCWFGGKNLPPLAKKCIASWKKYLPDYEIKEWNESNFDINCCDYVKEAYQAKKWAFVTDYVRLFVLVNEGGIYMDTDVEVIGSLDYFLENKAFSGFENSSYISTGIMASERNFKLFEEFLRTYEERKFIKANGEYDLTTNVVSLTEFCKKRGLIENNVKQNIQGYVIYPQEYFSPKDYFTGKINKTEFTKTIHHFSESWIRKEDKISLAIKRRTENKCGFICLLGKIVAGPFTYMGRIRRDGIKKATTITVFYIKEIIRTQSVK